MNGLHPCWQLVLQTTSVDVARDWLANASSIEGVVAKRTNGPYRPGTREWLKIKRVHTVDCIVIGLAGDDREPMLVLALRHKDSELHHFGLTRPVPPELLQPTRALLYRASAPEPRSVRVGDMTQYRHGGEFHQN